MAPYDAVFLAVAVAVVIGPVERLWWSALAPVVVWVCESMAPAGFGFPLAAGVILLVAPGAAPVALVLAIPAYEGAGDVLRVMLLWALAMVLIEALGDRLLHADELPLRLRGSPLSLAACAIMYFALQPLAYVFR